MCESYEQDVMELHDEYMRVQRNTLSQWARGHLSNRDIRHASEADLNYLIRDVARLRREYGLGVVTDAA